MKSTPSPEAETLVDERFHIRSVEMTHQVGLWEYDPVADRLEWTFPEVLSFERMTKDERRKILEPIRGAADANGHGTVHEELRVGAPDQWIALYGRRVPNGDGRTKLVGVVVDISDQKSRAAKTEIVIHELEHRVRNAAAIAQSLAISVLRESGSVANAKQTLSDHFDTMNQHALSLNEASWRRTTITAMVEVALKELGIGDRCDLRGPPAEVSASVARALYMAIHELATNAMKYGALATASGRVKLSWRRMEDRHAAIFEWREVGGAIGKASSIEGYGSRLLNTVLRAEQTRVDYSFSKTGLVCALVGVPLCAVPA